jgi:hypothetical protein
MAPASTGVLLTIGPQLCSRLRRRQRRLTAPPWSGEPSRMIGRWASAGGAAWRRRRGNGRARIRFQTEPAHPTTVIWLLARISEDVLKFYARTSSSEEER